MTCSSINMLPNLQSLWIRDSSPFKSNFDCLITFPTLFLLFVNLHPRIFSPISFRVKRMAVGGLGGRGRKKTKHRCVKNTSVGCLLHLPETQIWAPDWEMNPDWCSNHWTTRVRAFPLFKFFKWRMKCQISERYKKSKWKWY